MLVSFAKVVISTEKKMDFLTIFLLLVCVQFGSSFQDTEDLTLRINDGQILGRYMTSESGRTIKAFMGIPFARPPVGNLRFKAPQKVATWDGILATQNEPPKCPQIDTFIGMGTFEGEEDCLYLNVYVPETRSSEPLDVLVWFHGGVGTFIYFTQQVSSDCQFLVCLLGICDRNIGGFIIWS